MLQKVTTTTDNIPTSALTPWFCAMSGTTTADAAWCDYIMVEAQRTTEGMTAYFLEFLKNQRYKHFTIARTDFSTQKIYLVYFLYTLPEFYRWDLE